MTMKVVYIAGPFRAENSWLVAQNVRAAEHAGYIVALLGGMPLIPHSNTANFDGTITSRFWLDGTMELMRRCDAVFVFARYSGSEGTALEIAEAGRLGIPVMYDLGQLECWLKRQVVDGQTAAPATGD